MQAVRPGCTAVLNEQTVVASIIRLPHGSMYTDVGGDSGEDDVLDAFASQDSVQIRAGEGSFAGLVNYDLQIH